jgi:hypothetical protein
MTEDENPSNTIEEADFLSSVIEIEMDHCGNDIAGTKAVLMGSSSYPACGNSGFLSCTT